MGNNYAKITDSNRVIIISQSKTHYNVTYLDKSYSIKIEDINAIARDINWKIHDEVLIDLIAIYIDNCQDINKTIKAITG